MTNVQPWVRKIVEDTFGLCPLEVGKKYDHPEQGPIKITSGQYWGTYGLSNFWNWTVVKTGEEKCGYGGNWKEII